MCRLREVDAFGMRIDHSCQECIAGAGSIDDLAGQGREEPFLGGIAAIDAFAAERDIDMRHTEVEQHLCRLGIGRGLRDGERLFEVELERMEVGQLAFAKGIDHTMRLGRADAVDEERHRDVLHQPADRVLGEVGIRHDELGHIDLPDPFGEPFGRDRADSLGVGHGRYHLAPMIMDTEVDAGSQGIDPLG